MSLELPDGVEIPFEENGCINNLERNSIAGEETILVVCDVGGEVEEVMGVKEPCKEHKYYDDSDSERDD